MKKRETRSGYLSLRLTSSDLLCLLQFQARRRLKTRSEAVRVAILEAAALHKSTPRGKAKQEVSAT